MTKTYLELVGLQVIGSRLADCYRIENIYVRTNGKEYGETYTMKGYDMPLKDKFQRVVQSLMDAYAPAIKHVWKQQDGVSQIFYLQFVKAFGPDIIDCGGRWYHWAEW